MSYRRWVPLVVLVVMTCSCAWLPRVSTLQMCNASAPSQLVVQAVDAAGKDVPFAPVSVISDDRATRLSVSTSSRGAATMPLQPGSYRVQVGDSMGDWPHAFSTFTLRPGCTVTARAALIRHDIDPVDTPLRKRMAR
jgi:hypothetical protein